MIQQYAYLKGIYEFKDYINQRISRNQFLMKKIINDFYRSFVYAYLNKKQNVDEIVLEEEI